MTARISTTTKGYVVAVYRNNKLVDIFLASTMLEIEYKFSKYMKGGV
jgi:hypothetical protein